MVTKQETRARIIALQDRLGLSNSAMAYLLTDNKTGGYDTYRKWVAGEDSSELRKPTNSVLAHLTTLEEMLDNNEDEAKIFIKKRAHGLD